MGLASVRVEVGVQQAIANSYNDNDYTVTQVVPTTDANQARQNLVA
jgi:hypothetical protein